ncbi:hypothetical protein B0H17DRAFT_1091984, partial [Mycena rosella]
MSFVRRLVQRLRRPNYFVGKDLEGNRYFEHPSVLDDPRPKRTVKYSGSGDMWTYVGGSRRLAVQWSSWLTHTRPDPPTLEAPAQGRTQTAPRHALKHPLRRPPALDAPRRPPRPI